MATEKKERTGGTKLKFGVLDAAIIIIVIALIASVVLRYTTDNSFFTADSKSYSVTLKISNVRYTTYDMITSGESIYLDNGQLLGQITQASVTPSVYYASGSDGKMTPVYYPDNTFVDIVTVVSCELINKDGRIVTSKGEHIGIGVELSLHTESVDMMVEITEIEAAAE